MRNSTWTHVLFLFALCFLMLTGYDDGSNSCCRAAAEEGMDEVIDSSPDTSDSVVSAATGKTWIKRDFLMRLPNSDDLFVAFGLVPGANGSGNIRVHGGALNDNLYIFDGIDTTDPWTSTIFGKPYADTIDTIEILTGAFPAEYGRSMGGIINAVTKSGSSDFHGIMRYKNMNSDTRADDDWSDYRVLSDYDYNDYAITLDGPIVQDKLWFMISYNYYNMKESEKVFGGYGWRDSHTKTVNMDREYHFPMARLTFQPSADHRFAFVLNAESSIWHNYSGSLYNSSPETLNTLELKRPYYGLEWTWIVNADLHMTTRLGGSFGTIEDKPTSGNDTDPPFYDTYWQANYNNSTIWTEDDRSRIQYSISADYRLDDFFGSHEWKSGVEYQKMQTDNLFRIPGGATYVISQFPVGDPDNPDYYTGDDATRSIQLHRNSAETSGEYIALFLQDDWEATDRITLNLGMRYENMTYENDAGESDVPAWRWGDFAWETYLNTGSDRNGYPDFKNKASMEFDQMIAPRVGLNWDIFGSGKTTAHAFFGRYYDPFDLSLPRLFQPFESDSFARREQTYQGPEWTDKDKDGVPDEDYFYEDRNWVTTGEDEPGDSNMIDPDLKPEYTDEISVGIRHELIPDVSVSVVYTNRKTRNLIEDVGLFMDRDQNVVWTYRGGVKDDFSGLDPDKQFDPRDTGQDYYKHLYWVTNATGNKRDYSGIEISATVNKPDWDMLASYTYSKAEGTVLEGSPGETGITQFSGLYDTYQTSLNLYGELPWSCRHYLKLAGSYHFNLTDWYEMSFGVNSFLRSGYFYSKRTAPNYTYDPDSPSNDINNPSTWTGRPPYRSYAWFHPEGRGGYELPGYYTIDISWQNTFMFGKFGSATIIFDVENLTNKQSVTSEADIYNPNRPALFGQQNAWGTPREYRLSLMYRF